MNTGRRCGWGLALLLAALSLSAAQQDRKRTEADLKALTDRIERIQRQVQQDAIDKDRFTRNLRSAEQAVAAARTDLAQVRSDRQQHSAARDRLVAERAQRESERRQAQADLAAQLRSAYMMGRNEPLKLLLNQRSPAQFGRNLAYYGYLGRDRATKINLITDNISKIDELKLQIDAEDQQLAQLEQRRQQRLGQLDQSRKERGQVLASLEKESQDRGATLKRLKQQQEQLEDLLAKLRRAAEATPFDPNDPFAKLRGQLAWPVAGRLETGFGDAIAGGLRSNGIEIAADRGVDVHAVHEGRVIYADWLSGRGLLIILDHGNGYMSLYGHNDQLYKQVGATVRAGEAIAAAGDSGGRSHPGLYFEIRKGGKPIDPAGWFKSKLPPGS